MKQLALFSVFRFAIRLVAEVLLEAAISSEEKRILSRAIRIAEASGMKGQDKMRTAIQHIKQEGIDELKSAGESTLRTKLEEQLDRLEGRTAIGRLLKR
jgi:hypothetical protein